MLRLGIDLGGTKTEGVVMDEASIILHRQRVATPGGNYDETLSCIVTLVGELENAVGATQPLRVGLAHPGALPANGLLTNSNSVCLNGQPLKRDLEARLSREIRMANDADCLAISEASDGAAAGAANVFAVILGTGVGGGIAINGRLLRGRNGIAGEWGHIALPWARSEWNEVPGPACWCGRHGCIETWLSGTSLGADHARVTGAALTGEQVVQAADAGNTDALATLARYEDRLARGLSTIINILDPEAIVLGGGVSRMQRLYRNIPALWKQWVFSDQVETRLLPALHGDSSGVRGAAWLWPA